MLKSIDRYLTHSFRFPILFHGRICYPTIGRQIVFWRTMPKSYSVVSKFALTSLIIILCSCSKHEVETLPLVPVKGTVTVAGKPLDRGYIQFVPIDARPAKHKYRSASQVQPDGNYSLKTHRQPGAPLGNYKVVVAATATPMPEPSKRSGWVPDWIVHEKYTNPTTTDLQVEVTESAQEGTYDFTLER